MIRPLLSWKTRSRTGEISFSEVVKPGTSALVESVRKRSTPSSPSRAKARRSVIRPSSGSWSILKSPVCSTSPAPVRIATASASGMEWLTATNSRSKGPKLIRSPSRTLWWTVSCSRCSRSLLSSSASVSSEPTSGMSPRSRSRNGVAPMWSSWPWVRTSASTSSSRSRIGSKSGRIRSTPGVVLLGEQHAAVDDQQPAVVLEDGHVAADLPEATERDDAQRSGLEVGRGGELGMRVGHGLALVRSARTPRGRRGARRPRRRPGAAAGDVRRGCRSHRAAATPPWRWSRRSWAPT